MRSILLAVSTLALAVPASAQTPPAAVPAEQASPALQARAKELMGILTGKEDYDAFFAPGFRTQVPKDKFAAVNAQLTAAYGAPVAIASVTADTPWSGTIQVRFEKAVLVMKMSVDPTAPHQVSGLRVLGPAAQEKSLGEVTAALQGLPGATAFAFAKLGTGAPQLTLRHNADKPLAVGSAFKLVILAELIRSINAGERKWDDSITLDGRQLPGGAYTMVPKGTAVPLRELAMKMISVSDNSATDILLFALGREKVEAMLPVLGVSRDPRNLPYLSTLEAFKLKWLEGGKLGERYIAADDATQRAMLDGEIATVDIAPLQAMRNIPRVPSRIDQLEWFFSPADLIRVMDWLRRNTEGAGGADARAVLSKNPGLTFDKAQYSWIGFKGGSEPGVINLTLLLQGTDGAWYAAAATWNDTTKEVENERFAALMTALVKFAGPGK